MRKRNLLLATISGLMLALAMPRPGAWPLAWVALVPLLAAVRAARAREAAWWGFVTGSVYFAIILFWLTLFGYLPWMMVALLLGGAPMALFAIMAARLMPARNTWGSYIALPAAWTAVQWLRSLGPLGFPWGSMAHIHANILPMIQLSSLTGPWGIDFIVCLFNVAIAAILIGPKGQRRWQAAVIAACLAGAAFAGGHWVVRASDAHPGDVKVAVVQGNLSQDVNAVRNYLNYAFNSYSSLTDEAAISRPDFIIWPETTLPAPIIEAGWGSAIARVARETESNMVVGAYDPSRDPANPLSYNGAHFYDRSGRKLGVYHKVHLVPYGEYVPLRGAMPFLRRYGIREKDVLPGRSHVLVDTEFGKVGVSICFESLFPQISRLETRNGAAVLFILTNDSWFQRSQAARQHLMMARLRAVENRRYVVRAAATGISAVIDPLGRVQNELGIFQRGVVRGEIKPIHKLSLYARIGDALAYLCAIVALLAYLRTVWRVKV